MFRKTTYLFDHMSTPTAHPLQWPQGWPITPTYQRGTPKFRTTIESALRELQTEVKMLGGTDLVLSSNYTLGVSNPKEPGVVAYFIYNKNRVAIPCDRWLRIENNVKAIALTINAMRGMERWGAKHMIEAMFTGFKQLPPSSKRDWWVVLGFGRPTGRPDASSDSAISDRYRSLAQQKHPDRGGSNADMVELNAAYEDAKEWLKS